MLLANGVVGGLAFLCLILLVTVIVFAVKFMLDRNLLASPEEEELEEKREEPQTETKARPDAPAPQPLYVIRERPARKKKPAPRRPSAPARPENALFRLERVEPEKTTEKVS